MENSVRRALHEQPIDIEGLGQWVKQARRSYNITQEDLAYKIGLSKSFISQLESGRAKGAKPETVDAIICALTTTDDEAKLIVNKYKRLSPEYFAGYVAELIVREAILDNISAVKRMAEHQHNMAAWLDGLVQLLESQCTPPQLTDHLQQIDALMPDDIKTKFLSVDESIATSK